jgi:hypothetical protein
MPWRAALLSPATNQQVTATNPRELGDHEPNRITRRAAPETAPASYDRRCPCGSTGCAAPATCNALARSSAWGTRGRQGAVPVARAGGRAGARSAAGAADVGQVWLFESHLGQVESEPVGEEQQLGAIPPAHVVRRAVQWFIVVPGESSPVGHRQKDAAARTNATSDGPHELVDVSEVLKYLKGAGNVEVPRLRHSQSQRHCPRLSAHARPARTPISMARRERWPSAAGRRQHFPQTLGRRSGVRKRCIHEGQAQCPPQTGRCPR